jgi:hypothetical protein
MRQCHGHVLRLAVYSKKLYNVTMAIFDITSLGASSPKFVASCPIIPAHNRITDLLKRPKLQKM